MTNAQQITIFNKAKSEGLHIAPVRHNFHLEKKGDTCLEIIKKRLPEPYKSKALDNIKNHPFLNPNFKTRSLAFAIKHSFYAPATPEGLNYWDDVIEKFSPNKRIFKPGSIWPSEWNQRIIKALTFDKKILTLVIDDYLGVAWNNEHEIFKEYFDKEVKVYDYVDY